MPRKKPPAKLAFRKIERDQDLDQNQLSRGMFFYQTFIPSSIKIQTMTQIYTNCIYTTYSRIYCWKQRRSRAALIPSLPWASWNSYLLWTDKTSPEQRICFGYWKWEWPGHGHGQWHWQNGAGRRDCSTDRHRWDRHRRDGRWGEWKWPFWKWKWPTRDHSTRNRWVGIRTGKYWRNWQHGRRTIIGSPETHQ